MSTGGSGGQENKTPTNRWYVKRIEISVSNKKNLLNRQQKSSSPFHDINMCWCPRVYLVNFSCCTSWIPNSPWATTW